MRGVNELNKSTMVAENGPAVANGTSRDASESTAAQNTGDSTNVDTTTLNDELAAAANYLQARISDPSLADTVTQAAERGDVHTATSTLSEAFVLALDAPPDPDGPSSLEGCMQEVLVWLRRKCDMELGLVNQLSQGLCRGTSSSNIRLRCMALLYNAVGEQDSKQRFSLLVSLISLASSLDKVPNIENTVLSKIDTFLKSWNSSVEDKRRIYKVCYDALKSAGMAEKAFAFNVKLLTLYNDASEEEFKSVHAETVDVIVQAIRLPKLYRFDTMLELDAVTRFEKQVDSDHSLLYELICIFVRDDLAVFRQFRTKHEELLKKYGIDAEVAEEKMRLLTFASLGIDSPDLTYEMIASALQISEDEVEHWVIRAISSGLVDAKINQLKSSVSIYRSTQRWFTREEWQPLSERINIWRENISDLLTVLREQKDSSGTGVAEVLAG